MTDYINLYATSTKVPIIKCLDGVYAVFISYKYYIITAKLNNEIIYIHSPGLSMGGIFYVGQILFIIPIKNPKKCSHVLVYGVGEQNIGLNPSICNTIFKNLLDSKILKPVVHSYTSEVRIKDVRLDYCLNYDKKLYVEIKSCFFTYNDTCIYPVKDLSKISSLHKPKITCISPRSCKHFRKLIELKGLVVFIAQRTDFNKFIINPQQRQLNELIQHIPAYIIKTYWANDTLYFHSINRI